MILQNYFIFFNLNTLKNQKNILTSSNDYKKCFEKNCKWTQKQKHILKWKMILQSSSKKWMFEFRKYARKTFQITSNKSEIVQFENVKLASMFLLRNRKLMLNFHSSFFCYRQKSNTKECSLHVCFKEFKFLDDNKYMRLIILTFVY
jgi:hypothetical protein